MYGSKSTLAGGGLASTGLALGWQAFVAVALVCAGVSLLALARRGGKARP